MSTTVSTITLDALVRKILDDDLLDTVRIPDKLEPITNYDRQLEGQYEIADVGHAVSLIEKLQLTPVELAVLDNLCRWNFRNGGGVMRATVGLIGVATIRLMGKQNNDARVTASDSSALTSKFVKESVWTIRRILHLSTSSGPIEAKLPLINMSETFTKLAELSKTDEVAKESMKVSLATVRTDISIAPNGDKETFCSQLLIQTIKAAREYKLDDSFGKLRSLLTNAGHCANIIRAMSDDQGVQRLASDTLDQIHSTDRLLNANAVAADALLARMIDGEIVYDKLMDFARHQHRIVAVEAASTIALIAYVISSASTLIIDNQDIFLPVSRLIRYSGAGSRYVNEITETVNV